MLVIADVEGILQVFSIKKEQIQLHFKTLPGSSISSVKVTGAAGNAVDKIFVASGNEVRGYTRKGKLFLTFDSGMTEEIDSMYVLGNELFLCGKHTYTHYRDLKDNGSYLCGDKIVDVIAFHCQQSGRLISLIACEGRMIRALEHARVTLSMEIESSPTVLYIFQDGDCNAILFGTSDGRVGILDVENLKGFQRWLTSNESNNSPVSAIDSYDLSGNGTKQLIIGRKDGNIEVHQVYSNEESGETRCLFTYNCNEFITSLQCGVIASQGFDEIIVATYAGRIFGLTTKTTMDGELDNSTGSYMASADASQKIFNLKADIEELKIRVLKEREKYQLSTHSNYDDVSAIPLLMVKDSFILDKNTSTYNLTIEVPTAIDNILLQCNTEVKLMDAEKNSAIVSFSDSDEQGSNPLLATYRCQVNTNRLEMKIQTIEGKYGNLQAYVTPLVQPKCSRLLTYEIKALSLHHRLYQFDSNRPFNVLTLKGQFSLAEIHAWLGQCLPEVPEKPQVTEGTILWFGSTLLDSILECSYQKGEAEFKSDNISTISILKEALTSEATRRKIKIDISTYISEEAVHYVLKSIEGKLLSCQKLKKQLSLLNALDEIAVTEEETIKYLSRKYKDILRCQESIRKSAESNPLYLEKVYDIVVDLYVAHNKLKGLNSKQTVNLREVLEAYDYDKIIAFFRTEKQSLENAS
ncbi:Bardet-Biedl syndrome 7-like protein [Gonioctena quinquepunctata]|nr:Bardet-Biedl syndrome 7-like protein [Gonioctena quinquepunctata]